MSSNLSLSIKMSILAITPSVLDGLASEYYGSVLSFAGEDGGDTLVVEFAGVSAEAHLNSFSAALDSYRLPE